MKRREEEILNSLLFLLEKTKGFTEPELVMIGGYALRAFTPFSRFTRDCDFDDEKKWLEHR
jgi:predicted nucleotidyltransferase component of viral defense system